MHSPTSSDLTLRQRQVITEFCCGKTYREVAAELGLSPATINPVLKAIARKKHTRKIARAHLCRLLGL